MYRWHIADPVRFTKSLRFDIEHTGWISADETESGKIEGTPSARTTSPPWPSGTRRDSPSGSRRCRRSPNGVSRTRRHHRGKALLAGSRKVLRRGRFQKGYD
jgi:hypothetical protein